MYDSLSNISCQHMNFNIFTSHHLINLRHKNISTFHQPSFPPQKKEANPNTRNSSLYLGFSPWPSMPVRTSWALTITMFHEKSHIIHNIKWDDPLFIAAPSVLQPPDHQPSDPRCRVTFLLFTFQTPKSHGAIAGSLKAVFSVTVRSRCLKGWGEPLQQLQV